MGSFDSSRSQGTAGGNNIDNLAALHDEILLHQQHDKNQGVLTSLLAHVWDGGSSQSLKQLQSLHDQADAARASGNTEELKRIRQAAQQSVESDEKALGNCDTKLSYATGAMKTVGLFMGNKWGLATTLGVYALDNAKSGDTALRQIEDGVLGAGKGLALRKTFEIAGNHGWGPIQQGVSIGFLSRFSDLALTRSTYDNGFLNGVGDSLTKAADKRALAIDAATFVVARGVFGGLNLASQGRIASSRMLSTMATGGSFGATTGATNEIARQTTGKEKFDLGKVLRSGLIQGGIDSLAAAPGGAMSARAAFSGRNVESGARAENQRETASSSDSARQPRREFAVTSGQETLNSFISGEGSSNGAMLKVREIINGRHGTEQKLFVQHLDQGQLLRTAAAADIVANCIPDGSRPAANHVLPESTGPIRLSANADGNRIAFSAGDNTAAGYARSVELGEQNGEKLQSELFSWTLQANGPGFSGLDPELHEARALRDEVQKLVNKGVWQFFQTGKRSAADQVGMDYILLNRQDGRWYFFDTTLDPAAKAKASELRRPGIIAIEREDGSIALRTRIDFMNRVLDATKGDSPFNTRDMQPPSSDAAMSESEQAKEIARYRKQIADKMARLRSQANSHSDETEQWYLRQQAEDFQKYDEDVSLAQKFVDAAAGESADPAYPRHFAAAKVAIKQVARNLVGPMIGRAQLSPEHGNGSVKTRVEYDKQYDELAIWANGQRFQIEGASKLIAEAIESAVYRKNLQNFDYKRRLLSGSTTEAVTRGVIDRLERMWTGDIIGEPGLKDPPPKPLGQKKGQRKGGGARW